MSGLFRSSSPFIRRRSFFNFWSYRAIFQTLSIGQCLSHKGLMVRTKIPFCVVQIGSMTSFRQRHWWYLLSDLVVVFHGHFSKPSSLSIPKIVTFLIDIVTHFNIVIDSHSEKSMRNTQAFCRQILQVIRKKHVHLKRFTKTCTISLPISTQVFKTLYES
ncbi:unnamed protein product [Albugo candida]|uniref:Uncharacterized protein n=1 Tax=Albugo candida TaxID=65357 RepID=A0A024GFP0_9STRA|nr:unnamed protein product [Albugo candida]|eukprot:CCI45696.1 unnamed protein product [Albugo candida]